MTIKELIELLQEQDPQIEGIKVVMQSSLSDSFLSIEYIEYNDVEKRIELFYE